MTVAVDSLLDPQEHRRETFGLTESEISKMSDFELRKYGQLDQDTLEAMLVGYLVSDPDTDDDKYGNPRNAEKLMESGLKGIHFDKKVLGDMYDDLLQYYRETRTLLTPDEAIQRNIAVGQKHDEALIYKSTLSKCHAATIGRRISLDLLLKRMKNHYRCKTADKIIQKFAKDRSDPMIGPEKAIDAFRTHVAKTLVEIGSESVKEFNPARDYDIILAKAKDQKDNPEKYAGLACGLRAIDVKTTGFKPGELTVFVGRHGGYKSTVMLNIAFGLWERGANILYVSLEMAGEQVIGKYLCRGARGVSWSKMYTGKLSEPTDWAEIKKIEERLEKDKDLTEQDKIALTKRKTILLEATAGVTPGREDTVLVSEFKKKMDDHPNQISIITFGQSQKTKISAIEKYIEEKAETFKPHVVIIDYLALVASDQPYPDRRDLEVGDVCKYMRGMGKRLNFSVITAAQFKRAAIDRIRKFGFSNPEKASMGTDDIAESSQIGADADNVFMLWPQEGGNALVLLTPKARNSATDTEKGTILQVQPDWCLISDNIEDTSMIAADITQKDIAESMVRLGQGKKLGRNIPDEEEPDPSFSSDNEISLVDEGMDKDPTNV